MSLTAALRRAVDNLFTDQAVATKLRGLQSEEVTNGGLDRRSDFGDEAFWGIMVHVCHYPTGAVC